MSWVRDQLCQLMNKKLTVTKHPLYEYRDIWAEESGQLSQGQTQWSYGGNAVGVTGQRIDTGWEVIAISFHANTHAFLSSVTINLYNFASGVVSSSNVIASITLESATDGGGQVNNSHKFVEFSSGVAVPDNAVLGFETGQKTGNISNVRVYARLRRKTGEYISDVKLN